MACSGEKCPSIQETGETDAKAMRRAFRRADSDSTGKIPCDQFSTAVKAAGFDATSDEIEEVFQKFDKEPDGDINFDEFVDMMKYFEDCGEKDMEANLRKAFRKFDRDGSGYISPEELRYVVCHTGEKLSHEEAEELIAMFDTNKDGELSWEEFLNFYKTSMIPEVEDQEEEGNQGEVSEDQGGDGGDDGEEKKNED